MNNKKELLELAEKLLKNIEVEKVGTVELDSTTHDDGSSSLVITVNYPKVFELPMGIEMSNRALR